MSQTTAIPFVKASACGNDFLIVEGKFAGDEIAALTRRMCDRHNGIGADGVEWLYPSHHADARIRLVNADGSDAEISGNGTRCVAAHLVTINGAQSVSIATDAGIKLCELTCRNGSYFEFKTDMGQPEVGAQLTLKLAGGSVSGTIVSTGNPHFVRFVEDFEGVWQNRAAEIGVHPQFPNGTNVELVRVTGPNNIEIRIFERGAGETQSSGTGSSASAAATIASGRAKSPLQVLAPGGSQVVEWEPPAHLFLSGPATLICHGEFFV